MSNLCRTLVMSSYYNDASTQRDRSVSPAHEKLREDVARLRNQEEEHRQYIDALEEKLHEANTKLEDVEKTTSDVSQKSHEVKLQEQKVQLESKEDYIRGLEHQLEQEQKKAVDLRKMVTDLEAENAHTLDLNEEHVKSLAQRAAVIQDMQKAIDRLRTECNQLRMNSEGDKSRRSSSSVSEEEHEEVKAELKQLHREQQTLRTRFADLEREYYSLEFLHRGCKKGAVDAIRVVTALETLLQISQEDKRLEEQREHLEAYRKTLAASRDSSPTCSLSDLEGLDEEYYDDDDDEEENLPEDLEVEQVTTAVTKSFNERLEKLTRDLYIAHAENALLASEKDALAKEKEALAKDTRNLTNEAKRLGELVNSQEKIMDSTDTKGTIELKNRLEIAQKKEAVAILDCQAALEEKDAVTAELREIKKEMTIAVDDIHGRSLTGLSGGAMNGDSVTEQSLREDKLQRQVAQLLEEGEILRRENTRLISVTGGTQGGENAPEGITRISKGKAEGSLVGMPPTPIRASFVDATASSATDKKQDGIDGLLSKEAATSIWNASSADCPVQVSIGTQVEAVEDDGRPPIYIRGLQLLVIIACIAFIAIITTLFAFVQARWEIHQSQEANRDTMTVMMEKISEAEPVPALGTLIRLFQQVSMYDDRRQPMYG